MTMTRGSRTEPFPDPQVQGAKQYRHQLEWSRASIVNKFRLDIEIACKGNPEQIALWMQLVQLTMSNGPELNMTSTRIMVVEKHNFILCTI